MKQGSLSENRNLSTYKTPTDFEKIIWWFQKNVSIIGIGKSVLAIVKSTYARCACIWFHGGKVLIFLRLPLLSFSKLLSGTHLPIAKASYYGPPLSSLIHPQFQFLVISVAIILYFSVLNTCVSERKREILCLPQESDKWQFLFTLKFSTITSINVFAFRKHRRWFH